MSVTDDEEYQDYVEEGDEDAMNDYIEEEKDDEDFDTDDFEVDLPHSTAKTKTKANTKDEKKQKKQNDPQQLKSPGSKSLKSSIIEKGETKPKTSSQGSATSKPASKGKGLKLKKKNKNKDKVIDIHNDTENDAIVVPVSSSPPKPTQMEHQQQAGLECAKKKARTPTPKRKAIENGDGSTKNKRRTPTPKQGETGNQNRENLDTGNVVQEKRQQDQKDNGSCKFKVPKLDNTSLKVFNYLKTTNRPFGPTDVARKFKQDFSRSQINNALDNLMKKELARTNAKKSIYWVEQAVFGEVSDAILKDLSEKAEKMSSQLSGLKTRKQDLIVHLREIQREPKTCELDTSVQQFQNQVKSLKDRLNVLEHASGSLSDKGGKGGQSSSEAIISEAKFYRKMWSDRRAIVEDIIDEIIDQKPKKKNARDELYEDIGVDSDKSVNVNLKEVKI